MNNKVMTITVLLICVAITAFGVFYFTSIAPANKIQTEVRNAEIKDIDLSQVADGRYIGEFSYSRSHCKVEVNVSNHKITDIKILENGTNDHAKKAEAVLGKVIDEQKINVDAVSGSTTTSKALLKAVEAALSNK